MSFGGFIFQGDDDDRMIAAQVVSGQKDLFRLIIERYERPVYGMGLSFFHNKEDASDFAQEVFFKVFYNLHRFEGRSRLSTWLYKIAYNTAVNSINRKKEYHSLAEDEVLTKDGIPERVMLRKLAREAVLEAIRELPERFRLCIDLFFFYDRSLQEIEEITGYPVNTVKSHIFRAKKILREKLKAYAGLDFGGTEWKSTF